jgi:hypothetical protein
MGELVCPRCDIVQNMAEILGILTPTRNANNMRRVARSFPEESNGTIHIVDDTRPGPFRAIGMATDGGVAGIIMTHTIRDSRERNVGRC